MTALPHALPAGAVRRAIPGVGDAIPIVRIDADGAAAPFATLYPLAGGAIWAEEATGVRELHAGLPWFLGDMRPQGFMGRTFAQAHAGLGLGLDPRGWSDDAVLLALSRYGADLPGNLIVGAEALARWQATDPEAGALARAEVEAAYPRRAAEALQGTLPGSSAGGEQPKFAAAVDGVPLLVKFAPPGDSPAEQRLRDLLVCEHLALATLARHGVDAAASRIVQAGGRVFLESVRFDRTPQRPGAPAGGRIGMVSLEVYDAQYVGQGSHWGAVADRMAQQRLLTADDAAQLRLLDAYGALIANSDRHYGNISLLLDHPRDDWRLAPAYDMLPMRYAPVAGEVVERTVVPGPGVADAAQPLPGLAREWPRAAAMAAEFWDAAASDPRLSGGFRRTIAEPHRALLSSRAGRAGRG